MKIVSSLHTYNISKGSESDSRKDGVSHCFIGFIEGDEAEGFQGKSHFTIYGAWREPIYWKWDYTDWRFEPEEIYTDIRKALKIVTDNKKLFANSGIKVDMKKLYSPTGERAINAFKAIFV